MKLDLNVLKSYQEDLDKKICALHSLSSDQTTTRRILAFMVELGELANETRCFKYWSYKAASEKKVILEEYVDGIHFLISLSNELNLDLAFEIEELDCDLTKQFIDVFVLAGTLQTKFAEQELIKLFKKYLQLGVSLGFAEKEMISAYFQKNQVNHQRQEQHY